MGATTDITVSGVLVENIARVCHEANRAYCETIGDNSQKPWDEAEQWQRDSALSGVRYALENPDKGSADQHEAWCRTKEHEGWSHGPVKDAELKTHPCLVPYNELPEEQKKKDALFRAIVTALKPKGFRVSAELQHSIDQAKRGESSEFDPRSLKEDDGA